MCAIRTSLRLAVESGLDLGSSSARLRVNVACEEVLSAKKKTKTPSPAKRGGTTGKAESTAKRPSARALRSVADHDEPRSAERARGHSEKQAPAKAPPPAELATVFTSVEIDFFERAADMYAEEYDVWADFRPKDLN